MSETGGRAASPGRGRRPLLVIAMAAIVLVTVEAGAFGVWRWLVRPSARANVEALIDPAGRVPRLLPNTFWHHELNAAHPDYRGVVNARGVKGDDFDIPKPSGELRVICLGDSTVEESDVPPRPSRTSSSSSCASACSERGAIAP